MRKVLTNSTVWGRFFQLFFLSAVNAGQANDTMVCVLQCGKQVCDFCKSCWSVHVAMQAVSRGGLPCAKV